MAFLEQNGINVPPYRLVKNREDAAQVGQALGYPVVMKVVSPDIIHKSDVGGVKLNVKDDVSAMTSFDALQEVAKGNIFSGVIMYPMLKGAKEVILGLTIDRQFGPVVLFGMGGVYTEVLKDICLRIAPVNEQGAIEMIKSICSYPILAGVRGEDSVDLKALAKMIAAFSQLPFKHPEIQEVDINPVFAFPDAVYAADVRIIL
jgi:acyl-CoA synthetase (NDP forming)